MAEENEAELAWAVREARLLVTAFVVELLNIPPPQPAARMFGDDASITSTDGMIEAAGE